MNCESEIPSLLAALVQFIVPALAAELILTSMLPIVYHYESRPMYEQFLFYEHRIHVVFSSRGGWSLRADIGFVLLSI